MHEKARDRTVLRVPRAGIIAIHDATVAGLSFVLASLLGNGLELGYGDLQVLLLGTAIFLLIASVVFYYCGLHRPLWSCGSIADCAVIGRASTWAVLTLVAVIFIADPFDGMSRSVLVSQWFILVVLLCLPRLSWRLRKIRAGDGLPVLLYGTGRMAHLFLDAVHATPAAGLRVIGVIDADGKLAGRHIGDVPVLGPARDLRRILASLTVQGVVPGCLVMASATPGPADFAGVAAAASSHGKDVQHIPDILGLSDAGRTDPARRGDARPYFRLRRAIDAVLRAAALVLLLPVIGTIAALVLVDVGPPVLFRQVRPGRHLRPFTLYKFRTMRVAYDERTGVHLYDHERTSPIGLMLRRTRLDELPQLYNVLLGEMAFIGPRPLLPRDLPDGPVAAERAALRPGITGWAQVHGGHQLETREKVALDRWYARHAGPALDARIVALTIKTMVRGERIDQREVARAMAAA